MEVGLQSMSQIVGVWSLVVTSLEGVSDGQVHGVGQLSILWNLPHLVSVYLTSLLSQIAGVSIVVELELGHRSHCLQHIDCIVLQPPLVDADNATSQVVL